MYAVAFDLVVADTVQHHPKGGHEPIPTLKKTQLPEQVFTGSIRVDPKQPI